MSRVTARIKITASEVRSCQESCLGHEWAPADFQIKKVTSHNLAKRELVQLIAILTGFARIVFIWLNLFIPFCKNNRSTNNWRNRRFNEKMSWVFHYPRIMILIFNSVIIHNSEFKPNQNSETPITLCSSFTEKASSFIKKRRWTLKRIIFEVHLVVWPKTTTKLNTSSSILFIWYAL